MNKFNLLSIASICFSIMLTASPALSEVQTFGKSVKVIQYSNAKLQRDQRGLLRWLKSKSHKQYFGAMYINPTEDKAFAVTQFHSLESAKIAAKAGCRIESEHNGDQCTLYATVVPKSLSPQTTKASGLGLRAYSFFVGKYRSKQQSGKYGAFAISGMSNFGYSYQYDTKAEAIDTALSYCQSNVAKFMTSLNKEGRDLARKNGADKCSVVSVVHPN